MRRAASDDDTMLDAERKASPFCAGGRRGAIVVAKCDVSHAKGCAQKIIKLTIKKREEGDGRRVQEQNNRKIPAKGLF